MKKTCPNCGKEFETVNPRHIYCRYRCQHEFRLKKQRVDKTYYISCLWCKKKFEPFCLKKYCSPECSINFRQIKSRIMALFPFDDVREQNELRKLEELGKNYRFEDETENAFYELK